MAIACNLERINKITQFSWCSVNLVGRRYEKLNGWILTPKMYNAVTSSDLRGSDGRILLFIILK